jgi:hypothetical protein
VRVCQLSEGRANEERLSSRWKSQEAALREQHAKLASDHTAHARQQVAEAEKWVAPETTAQAAKAK